MKFIERRLLFYNEQEVYDYLIPCGIIEHGYIGGRIAYSYNVPLYFKKSSEYLKDYFIGIKQVIFGYIFSHQNKDCRISKSYKQLLKSSYLHNKAKWIISNIKIEKTELGLFDYMPVGFSSINFIIYFYLHAQKQELFKMGVDVSCLDRIVENNVRKIIEALKTLGPISQFDYDHWNSIYLNLCKVNDFTIYDNQMEKNENFLMLLSDVKY